MRVVFADNTTEDYEDDELAAGAQGSIHRSRDGKSVAKLYHPMDPKNNAETIRRINILITQFNPTKDPYWVEYFTWPEKRIVQPRVGYKMRMASGLKTLNHYIYSKSYKMLKPEEKGWLIGRVACAIKIMSAANVMASMGLSYPDFSDRNIMVEPFEGRIAFIDCDSLAVPTVLPATVLGSPEYMAPELVMETTKEPSVATDRHAMAVLLYTWLLSPDPTYPNKIHPLSGKQVHHINTEDDDKLRFGSKALYVDHPTNTANAIAGRKLSVDMLGKEIADLFRAAFIDGLQNPAKRPRPFEWQRALHHMYDRLIPCTSQHCSWRFFVAEPTKRLICPMCNKPVTYPSTLPFVYLLRHKRMGAPDNYDLNVMNAHYVSGWPERALYTWHMTPNATPIYTDANNVPNTKPQCFFEYDQHSNQWYLKNLTLLTAQFSDGKSSSPWQPWPKNTSLPLTQGMLIHFGNSADYFRARISLVKVI